MSITDPTLAEITMFGGNFAPRSWANCDGQLLPIAQNTALFSLLGTQYGGDGRTTFALPDYRGRTPVGIGNGPGLTPIVQAERGGSNTTILTVANLPSHGHAIAAREEGNTDDPNGAFVAGSGMTSFGTAADVTMASTSVTNTGGGQSFNNMQPFLGTRFIIALFGTFPSRN